MAESSCLIVLDELGTILLSFSNFEVDFDICNRFSTANSFS